MESLRDPCVCFAFGSGFISINRAFRFGFGFKKPPSNALFPSRRVPFNMISTFVIINDDVKLPGDSPKHWQFCVGSPQKRLPG
jgi:hypothetical protein